MTTTQIVSAPRTAVAPARPSHSILAGTFGIIRLLVLLPALLIAAVHHRRRGMDAESVWQADDSLFTQPGSLDLSVVLPFYNPGDALRPTVERLMSVAEEAGLDFEVIAVSDGSTDGSEDTIDGISPRVQVVRSAVNRGKGAALHRGFALARGRYVGFVDADGDIDPAHLIDYFQRAEAGGHEVVYASKRHAESRSASSAVRKLISYGFIAFVASLFALGINDTQTGCKLFRRDAIATVLPRLREQRFAFDLEFFVAARAAGIRRMVAAPVEIQARMAGSTVGRAAITRTLTDALAVLARLHFTPVYRTALLPTGSDAQVRATVIPMPRRAVEVRPTPTTPTLVTPKAA